MRIVLHRGSLGYSVVAVALVIWAGFWPVASHARPQAGQPDRFPPSAETLERIKTETEALATLLQQVRILPAPADQHPDDVYADIAVFEKAARWIVRFDEWTTKSSADQTLAALAIGRDRAAERLAGKPSSVGRTPGGWGRGYVSRVDGSIQPYALIVPEKAPDPDGDGRYRLDVILHGRDESITEVKHLMTHQGKPPEADQTGLLLHVYGRGNNAFRWAGETDVFEAIDAVRRSYPVDDRRIVLRGFSMGGAGAWHLGLHHPAKWVAVEAGAGFNDTKGFLNISLNPLEERTRVIYDAVEYARNASIVPVACYGGELDKQLQASTNIVEALRTQGFPIEVDGLITRSPGIDFIRVIGAQTGHKVDDASAALLKSFRDEHAAAGLPLDPRPAQFTTFTTRYGQAPWFSVERLLKHYDRASVTIRPDSEGELVTVDQIENVALLAVDRRAGDSIRIGEQTLPLRQAAGGYLPRVYYRLVEGHWEVADYDLSRQIQENARGQKAPGVQGPIDDAFMGPFLCVRGTGTPWNPDAAAWADKRLETFRSTWAKHMRGELPLVTDAELTPELVAERHLILFGDPGSNSALAELVPALPIGWSKREIQVGDATFDAATHLPALILANPRNPRRYVVVNSGYSFTADDLAGNNARPYPRYGDYAVFRISDPVGSAPVTAGLFNESWRLGPDAPAVTQPAKAPTAEITPPGQ
jgi:pimeloyl-ACP methyl ester carboxylesterase